ncbi:Heavy metal transport/detoxification protein [Mycolicibacterium rhodesiae JS60]|nr:Heavy metal transport/detoxification protein [Mycolicibacterium rhodesiae JS60]
MMSVAIRVAGMSCGHCVETIRRAVSALGGVTRVDVDLAGGIVTVDGDCGVEAISAAIADAGYTPEEVIAPAPRPPLPLADSADSGRCCG